MNDRLPYDEQLAQQLNDLPLPDENKAWEDMKQRLDKDDDDGIIPIWLRGCGLWGLLAVVLLGIGWWLIRPEKWWNKNQETENVKTINSKEDDNNNKIRTDDTVQTIKSTDREKTTSNTKDILKNSSADSSLTSLPAGQKKPVLKKKDDDISVLVTNPQSKKKETGNKQQTAKSGTEKNKKPGNKKKQTGNGQAIILVQPGLKDKETGSDPVEMKNKPFVTPKDSTVNTTTSTSKKDSAQRIIPDSVQKKTGEQTTKTNEQKKDSSKPKKISFSAGLAIHQLIPVSGQKLVPYNSQGRKGSLGDYIPSVFVRMYKNDKWFLQSEFRYGAPQTTKEFIYQQVIVPDSGSAPRYTSTTSSKLKKTYYHKLSLSFNHYILPNWSLGAGIIWNKFNSAVYEQEVVKRNNITGQDSSISKGIKQETQGSDSASVFSKTYFQAVIETQYKWKRFSLGARYSFGLQPYIKFTLPGGPQQEERNRSLEVFLRYELWKSKAKR